MSEKKYVVPEGMLKAATIHVRGSMVEMAVEDGVEKALRWLAENPIVPTPEQSAQLAEYQSKFGHNDVRHMQGSFGTSRDYPMLIAVEWQRRMFLALEPEVRQFVVDIAHSFQGVTLTESEFRYLMDFVDTHGVDRAKVAFRGKASPALSQNEK